jgi:hypothetical protein
LAVTTTRWFASNIYRDLRPERKVFKPILLVSATFGATRDLGVCSPHARAGVAPALRAHSRSATLPTACAAAADR